MWFGRLLFSFRKSNADCDEGRGRKECFVSAAIFAQFPLAISPELPLPSL